MDSYFDHVSTAEMQEMFNQEVHRKNLEIQELEQEVRDLKLQLATALGSMALLEQEIRELKLLLATANGAIAFWKNS